MYGPTLPAAAPELQTVTATQTLNPLPTFFSRAGRLVFGCLGLGKLQGQPLPDAAARLQAQTALDAALAHGLRVFDHADIYGNGRAESLFGDWWPQCGVPREQLIVQSKCGIREAGDGGVGRYDFSAAHIVHSVEQSLRRLRCDYLDVLLLHRPDPLMQPDEIAAVFSALHQQGKVRHFGVSNFGWPQMQLLQAALDQPLIVNQLPMSLHDCDWIEQNLLTGRRDGAETFFSYGTVEYCQLQRVQLQAWGSLAKGRYSGAANANGTASASNAEDARTRECVARLASAYGTTPEAIVLAFLLRHPAAIQPVVGSTHPARIGACVQALKVNLSREHWYELLVTRRGRALP